MSTNGNGAPVTMPDWQIPQRHSKLSAAQRAKLTDDMVAAIQEQRKQINALTQAVKALQHQTYQLMPAVRPSYDVILDTFHSEPIQTQDRLYDALKADVQEAKRQGDAFIAEQTFWSRLRWLVMGR